MVPLKDAADAIAAGSPLTILAGYHDYRTDVIAVRSDIQDAAGLAGKTSSSVTPQTQPCAWPRSATPVGTSQGVEATTVLPDGGPDAWIQALLNGDVALAPIQNRDRLTVERAGDVLIVDQQRYGDDVLVARRDLPSTAPATVEAFQTAYVRALQAMTAAIP